MDKDIRLILSLAVNPVVWLIAIGVLPVLIMMWIFGDCDD